MTRERALLIGEETETILDYRGGPQALAKVIPGEEELEQPLEHEKGRSASLLLTPPKGMRSCQRPDFSPVEAISDFSASRTTRQ